MADVRRRLESTDDRALARLAARPQSRTTPPSCSPSISSRSCSHSPTPTSACVSTACSPPRWRMPDCPLFVISTVRSDFLDRFADDLPRLVAVRNRVARPWTLAPIGEDGLREVIEGPARLAGLDVSEVKEAMVAEARDEPGALPLVENALHTLWEQRGGNRLSGRLLTEQGGLAGILSRGADALLDGLDKPRRDRALELLFRLVQVDPEGRRHTRRGMPLDEAIAIAGGGEVGRGLLDRMAGATCPRRTQCRGPFAADHHQRGESERKSGARRPLGQPDPRDADPEQGPGRRWQERSPTGRRCGTTSRRTRSGRHGGNACSFWRGSGKIAAVSRGCSGSRAGRRCSDFAAGGAGQP